MTAALTVDTLQTVETVDTVETVETVETLENVETVETVETALTVPINQCPTFFISSHYIKIHLLFVVGRCVEIDDWENLQLPRPTSIYNNFNYYNYY